MKYLILLILGAVASNVILYSLSHSFIVNTLYSAHIKIKTTGEILLHPLMLTSAIIMVAATVSVAVVSFIGNRLIDKRLEKLFEGLKGLGAGNLTVRLPANNKEEFSELFTIFNDASGKLNDKVSSLTKEIDEIEAEISKQDIKGSAQVVNLLDKVNYLIKGL